MSFDPELTGDALLSLVIGIEAAIGSRSAGCTPLGSAVTQLCEQAIERDHALRSETERPLPPSLAVIPNIPLESQTLEQLQAERDYWTARVADAPGFASAKAADNFRLACEAWIERRSP